ncbi:MAG TPA: branched-chain amino acid ABC transporter permease [Syntrophorhabdales bacterium]|nr:branched-chain amino acid ABC transporter permease [Syntrophorhabdales bacterium]
MIPSLAGIITVCLFLLPLLLPGPYYIHVFILTMLNIVLASSLRLINLSGQMSLAHGGMMTIGAYTSALLVMKAGLSFWVAMPISGFVTALIAYIIGYPFVRLKGIYFSIVTIFFSEVVVLTAQQWQSLTQGAAGIFGIPRPNPVSLFGILHVNFSSKVDFYYLALVLMLICLIILYAVEKSRIGMILRGVQQADSLAESVGIDTTGFKVLAFAVGSFFPGVLGAFYSHYISAINPDAFAFLFTIYILIYMTVGGENRFFGPILGAAVLTILPEVSRPLKAFEPFVFAAVLIAVIFFVPEGMVGLPKMLNRALRSSEKEPTHA